MHDCKMGGALWWDEYVRDDSGGFYVRTEPVKQSMIKTQDVGCHCTILSINWWIASLCERFPPVIDTPNHVLRWDPSKQNNE